MSSESMTSYRQKLLANVKGDVLEIGFGTGLNLPYYSKAVTSLVAVDPNGGMKAIAQKRISNSSIPVETRAISGEKLPMPDNHFDNVVCTWTLCSIPNVEQALREAYRVLKPSGQFFFIEHGLSDERGIQKLQNWITPVQKVVADGCHLNRKIDVLVSSVFDRVELEAFYADDLPKVMGYFYQGVATKQPSEKNESSKDKP